MILEVTNAPLDFTCEGCESRAATTWFISKTNGDRIYSCKECAGYCLMFLADDTLNQVVDETRDHIEADICTQCGKITPRKASNGAECRDETEMLLPQIDKNGLPPIVREGLAQIPNTRDLQKRANADQTQLDPS